jgi:hypothetical protein
VDSRVLLELRKTQERRMVRHAQTHLSVLLKWTRDGNVNCHDMLLLLRAEMMSIEKNLDLAQVRKAYDTAISSSSRSGYVHNAAIANEKAALFSNSRAIVSGLSITWRKPTKNMLNGMRGGRWNSLSYDIHCSVNCTAKVGVILLCQDLCRGAPDSKGSTGANTKRCPFTKALLNKFRREDGVLLRHSETGAFCCRHLLR